MKPEKKEFRETVRKFRASAKMFNCDIKLPIYWELIEECMEVSDANAHFIIQQCENFIERKIQSLENQFGIKLS